jgi:hypothetical protein
MRVGMMLAMGVVMDCPTLVCKYLTEAVGGITYAVVMAAMGIMLEIVLMIMIAVHLAMDVSNQLPSMTKPKDGAVCLEPPVWKCAPPPLLAQLVPVWPR